MKSGITSGVIYPRAVCELAKTYRLRSVGGSSAGAIAAAGAAAAELGRTAGGFELLEALPDDITATSPAGGSVLFRLFQPAKQMSALYRVFTAGMDKSANKATPSPAGQADRGRARPPSFVVGLLPKLGPLLTGFWLWALGRRGARDHPDRPQRVRPRAGGLRWRAGRVTPGHGSGRRWVLCGGLPGGSRA